MFLIWDGENWIEGEPKTGDLVREIILQGTSDEHYHQYYYEEIVEE